MLEKKNKKKKMQREGVRRPPRNQMPGLKMRRTRTKGVVGGWGRSWYRPQRRKKVPKHC